MKLQEFLDIGDIRKFREQLENIEQSDERYAPFAQQLRPLVEEFQLEQIWEFLKKHDYNINGKRKVLGVCGEVYFMSSKNNFNGSSYHTTLHEIIQDGYKLKQQEAEATAIPEYTMEELIEKMGHEFKIRSNGRETI